MNQPYVRHRGVSVIIVARRPSRHLEGLLRETQRMTFRKDVIVVCSPDDSRTHALASRRGGIAVLADPHCSAGEKLALGAAQAEGNILLFLDDSACIPAKRLQRFIFPLIKGRDIVLSIYAKRRRSSHSAASQLLNHVAGKRHLGTGSLCEFPFAMNRLVFDTLEFAASSPPVVQARAMVQGYSFGAVRLRGGVPKQPQIVCQPSPEAESGKAGRLTKDLVLQEHAKAISLLLQEKGERGDLWDGNRFRPLLQVPGRYHLRSVFRTSRDAWEMKRGGGWGEKRKAKRTYSRKKR